MRRFRLDLRKKFFTMRVGRPWNRFSRDAAPTASLGVFKARLDGALSTLVWWKVSVGTVSSLCDHWGCLRKGSVQGARMETVGSKLSVCGNLLHVFDQLTLCPFPWPRG